MSQAQNKQIFLPYELVPKTRRFRRSLHQEAIMSCCMYPSVYTILNFTSSITSPQPLGKYPVVGFTSKRIEIEETIENVAISQPPPLPQRNNSTGKIKSGRKKGRPRKIIKPELEANSVDKITVVDSELNSKQSQTLLTPETAENGKLPQITEISSVEHPIIQNFAKIQPEDGITRKSKQRRKSFPKKVTNIGFITTPSPRVIDSVLEHKTPWFKEKNEVNILEYDGSGEVADACENSSTKEQIQIGIDGKQNLASEVTTKTTKLESSSSIQQQDKLQDASEIHNTSLNAEKHSLQCINNTAAEKQPTEIHHASELIIEKLVSTVEIPNEEAKNEQIETLVKESVVLSPIISVTTTCAKLPIQLDESQLELYGGLDRKHVQEGYIKSINPFIVSIKCTKELEQAIKSCSKKKRKSNQKAAAARRVSSIKQQKLITIEEDPNISETCRKLLCSLRCNYGSGVLGCVEQIIQLLDYYRDFDRRTKLSEIWRNKTTKYEKIQLSLSEYVKTLDLHVNQREKFIAVSMRAIST